MEGLLHRVPTYQLNSPKLGLSLCSPTPDILSAADRTTAECTAHIIWLTGHSPPTALAIPAIGQGTLQDRLSRSVPAITVVGITYVRSTDEGFGIALVIRVGMCSSVSDGSFEDK